MTHDSNDQGQLKAIALTLTKADIDDYKRRHEPRWPVWRALPRVELWQAVALSLGIEPIDSLREDAKRGPLVHSMRVTRSRLPSEFFDRLNVSKRALSTNGPIRPQGSFYAGMLQNPCCHVLLAEVAAFLVLAEFTVPDEMRAMPTNVADNVRSATGQAATVGAPAPAGADDARDAAVQVAAVAALSLAVEPAGDKSLTRDAMGKRAALLARFRELDGKRPREGGKKGKHGALAALERETKIDDKNLGQMLDKAIEDKRGADAFAQLAQKR